MERLDPCFGSVDTTLCECYRLVFCSDEEGYITGFSKDLIATVCEAAGVDCRTVWDKWSNCWDSTAGEHSMGGKGKENDLIFSAHQ